MFQAGATEIAWTPFRLSETNASFKAMTKVDQIVVTLHALLNLFSWPLIHSIPKLDPTSRNFRTEENDVPIAGCFNTSPQPEAY